MSKISIFISHASEDKDEIARPLAEALKDIPEYEVWYDEYSLTLGDSLREKIDEGLSKCDYGVVILSDNFFSKSWTQLELDGLFALQTTNRKVILPIWHKIDRDRIQSYSPILAGRMGVSTTEGISSIVNAISTATGATQTLAEITQTDSLLDSFIASDNEVTVANHHRSTLLSARGVKLAEESANAIKLGVLDRLDSVQKNVSNYRFEVKHPREQIFGHQSFNVRLPWSLIFNFEFVNTVSNSAEYAILEISLIKELSREWPKQPEYKIINQEEVKPFYPKGDKVLWRARKDYLEQDIVEMSIRMILERIQEEQKKVI